MVEEKSNKLSEEDLSWALLMPPFNYDSTTWLVALVYMEPSKDVQVDAEGENMQKHSLACWFDPMSVEVNHMWPWSI